MADTLAKQGDIVVDSKIDLVLDKKGRAVKSIENFLQIMRYEKLYESIRFNLMTNSAETAELQDDGSSITRAWDDVDDSVSTAFCQSKYGLYAPDMHQHALRLLFRERRYNPLLEMVESFIWDGQERCKFFLQEWLKADCSPYTQEVSRLIFAGGINRLYSPGTKFDDVPVLVGPQGSGKSTAIGALALNQKYFATVSDMSGDQKSIEGLTGAWICEISELAAFRKADVEALKSFITRTVDQYRKPYDRKVSALPRRCIFIGSTNNSQFLRDLTGNRRFYPIDVHSSGYSLIEHEDELYQYICQCWAEARDKYKAGQMPPVADKSLISAYQEAQEAALEDDWRLGQIQRELDVHKPAIGDVVCSKEVYRYLYQNPDLQPSAKDSREISAIMNRLPDWEKQSKKPYLKDFGQQRVWKRIALPNHEVDEPDDLPF